MMYELSAAARWSNSLTQLDLRKARRALAGRLALARTGSSIQLSATSPPLIVLFLYQVAGGIL